MSNNPQQVLDQKIEQFIRKYYHNELIKGGLYTLGLTSIVFLSAVLAEHFGNFNTTARSVLFFTLFGSFAAVLGRFVIIPLLNLYNVGGRLTKSKAAILIGGHFSEVDDKLTNVLQLREQSLETGSGGLLQASIDQKIALLDPVPFRQAVQFGDNLKYLRFVLPPVLIILLLWMVFPSLIGGSTDRLVHFNDDFIPAAPFEFNVEQETLHAIQGDDFELNVNLTGREVPSQAYIEVDGARFSLNKTDRSSFKHVFKNIQSSQSFVLVAGGFKSAPFTLNMLAKPMVLGIETQLNFPAYTGKSDRTSAGKGDLTIPEGTSVTWMINAKNTSFLSLLVDDSLHELTPVSKDMYSYKQRFTSTQPYQICPKNEQVISDTMSFLINVIPDQTPVIQVAAKIDSADSKNYYFTGDISDDYGFTRLTFSYKKKDDKAYIIRDLPINKQANNDVFYHFWDLNELAIIAGDEVEYFFEVWDNDGVNGAKSTKSALNVFKAPSLDEIGDQNKINASEMVDKMESAIKEATNMQKELKKFEKNLLEKKEMDWQDKKKLKDLLEQQKQLEKNIENVQQQFQQNMEQEYQYKEPNPEILKKQEQLQQLFDDVMNDEMKDLFRKMEEMMDEINKDKMEEMLQDMEMTDEDIEKELDRSLEIFKQLEFDKKMEETIDKLDELAKKQEELAKETEESKNAENKEEKQQELKDKQEELNKEFEKVQEDMKDLEKKNEDLEQPNDMPDTEKQEEDIKKDQEESSESLEKKKNKSASKSQKDAAKKMEEMAQQMKQAQQQQQEESNEEDIDDMRQLLENIVQLSFDQEKLFTELKSLAKTDPKYNTLSQLQRKLKDDAKMIEDSLFALSKRVPQLEATVNREMNEINKNIALSLDHLADRETKPAAVKQQLAMTSLNNLALMIDEVVQQMQQQMSQQKFGNSSCSKPGANSSPKPGDMKKMQQALSKKLEEMMKQGKQKGKNPGGMMPGGKGQSKQLVKMAAEQAMLREELRKMQEQLGEQGGGSGLNKIADQMEKTEQDIVNNNITRQTLKRQQDILTKLLDFEKAQQEREMDNKRESKEANNAKKSNPNSFLEYNRMKRNKVELLKTVPATLNTYYRNKVNEYLNSLQKD